MNMCVGLTCLVGAGHFGRRANCEIYGRCHFAAFILERPANFMLSAYHYCRIGGFSWDNEHITRHNRFSDIALV